MSTINPIQFINPYAVFQLIISKKEKITKIALEVLAALAISQALPFSEEISSEEDRWDELSPTEVRYNAVLWNCLNNCPPLFNNTCRIVMNCYLNCYQTTPR